MHVPLSSRNKKRSDRNGQTVCLQVINVYVYLTETTQLWAPEICDSATG